MNSERVDKIPTTVVPLADIWLVTQFIRTSIAFCVIVGVWTGLRVYSRYVQRAGLARVEDILFYVSVVSFYSFVVAMYILLYLGGAGYHMDQLQKFHIARLTQSLLVMQGLYGLCMCTIKWSMLWTLKRIFVIRIFQIIVWVIIGLQAAWLAMTVLIGLLICHPIQKNFDPTAEGECGNQTAGYTAVSAVNVAIDIIMCVLPLPVVLRLHVKMSYKLALFGVFSLGIVTIVFAIIRLYSLRAVDFNDFSYTIVSPMTWTCAESGIVILVASSILLRPTFDKLFGRMITALSSKGDSSRGTSSVYIRSLRRPKTENRARVGFVTVEDSDERLELGDIPHRGRTEATATADRKDEFGCSVRPDGEIDTEARMEIRVERGVHQTRR